MSGIFELTETSNNGITQRNHISILGLNGYLLDTKSAALLSQPSSLRDYAINMAIKQQWYLGCKEFKDKEELRNTCNECKLFVY